MVYMRYLIAVLLLFMGKLSANDWDDLQLKMTKYEDMQFTRIYSMDRAFSIEIPNVWLEGLLQIDNRDSRKSGQYSFIMLQFYGNFFTVSSQTAAVESLEHFVKDSWDYSYYGSGANAFETSIEAVEALGIIYGAGESRVERYGFVRNGLTYQISFKFGWPWVAPEVFEHIRSTFQFEE
jgi:hypothetical protein